MFNVAKAREWFDDRRDLNSELPPPWNLLYHDSLTPARIEVYILTRLGASKKVNEGGTASYMAIESVRNLWIVCRHLVCEHPDQLTETDQPLRVSRAL